MLCLKGLKNKTEVFKYQPPSDKIQTQDRDPGGQANIWSDLSVLLIDLVALVIHLSETLGTIFAKFCPNYHGVLKIVLVSCKTFVLT